MWRSMYWWYFEKSLMYWWYLKGLGILILARANYVVGHWGHTYTYVGESRENLKGWCVFLWHWWCPGVTQILDWVRDATENLKAGPYQYVYYFKEIWSSPCTKKVSKFELTQLLYLAYKNWSVVKNRLKMQYQEFAVPIHIATCVFNFSANLICVF